MTPVALVISATVALTCPEARQRNLELALTWEHRARVCVVQRDACEARDALPAAPPEIITAPAPPPAIDWGIVIGAGLGGLVLGALVALALSR